MKKVNITILELGTEDNDVISRMLEVLEAEKVSDIENLIEPDIYCMDDLKQRTLDHFKEISSYNM